ncbi:EAL domain-containing protein [Paenibacillus sp. SGZ-1009]|uniref:sensor domain-containing protein n=1 Tax=Paenibacillus campi TaxID=3106031 RepID=UPI002AFE34F1|nr:EAL domain-containing protein [Paenibacillus sp. SGZ-1009]
MSNDLNEIPPLLALALDAIEDFVYVMRVHNEQFYYSYVNRSAAKFSSVSKQDLGKTFFDCYANEPEMANYLHNKYMKALSAGKSTRFEDGNVLPNGNLSGESIISPLRDDDQRITHLICVTRDCTERSRYEEKLKFYAYYDELTHLFNRRFLYEYKIEIGTLLLLNIDNFKGINDMMGHENGDALLIQVAARIKQLFTDGEIICRLGGDEFLVVCQNMERVPHLTAQMMLRALSGPFILKDREVKITASIGIAPLRQDINTQTALRHADIALHYAKSQGRSRYHVFDTSLRYEQIIRFHHELALNHCLERDELQLLYQPIYSTEQQRVVIVEALLRWHKNHKQLVSPAEFIPVAEETGLIIPIGDWVIRQVCRDLPILQRKYGNRIRIAVNISRIQLDDPDFIYRLNRILEEERIDANCIDLEITESVATSNAVEEQSSLSKLREQGYTISLDDFGTGYSSLSMLTRLPIDKIKIDRSFVTQMNPPVLKALITMAEALNLQVVAEGIEDQQQWDRLVELGYKEFQGYWFSYPMPVGNLPDLDHLSLA